MLYSQDVCNHIEHHHIGEQVEGGKGTDEGGTHVPLLIEVVEAGIEWSPQPGYHPEPAVSPHQEESEGDEEHGVEGHTVVQQEHVQDGEVRVQAEGMLPGATKVWFQMDMKGVAPMSKTCSLFLMKERPLFCRSVAMFLMVLIWLMMTKPASQPDVAKIRKDTTAKKKMVRGP